MVLLFLAIHKIDFWRLKIIYNDSWWTVCWKLWFPLFQNPDQGDEEEADEERMDEGIDLHFSACSTGLTNFLKIALLYYSTSVPALNQHHVILKNMADL